jgi:hypothetical protein
MSAEFNRCGNCKFWGSSCDGNETYRQCLAVIHDKRSFTSSLFDWDAENPDHDDIETTDGIRDARSKKAVVKDGSGYFAALRCRSDFGCVLFERKDDV